jgi:hypothetical protein
LDAFRFSISSLPAPVPDLIGMILQSIEKMAACFEAWMPGSSFCF